MATIEQRVRAQYPDVKESNLWPMICGEILRENDEKRRDNRRMRAIAEDVETRIIESSGDVFVDLGVTP
jgi:hypothetical protein